MKQHGKEEQRRQEDLALYRGIAWVGASFAIEVFLILANRGYLNFTTSQESLRMANLFYTLLRVLRLAAPAGGLACGIWLFVQRRQGKYALLPLVLTLSLFVLGFCSYVTLAFQDAGMRMLLLLIPALGAVGLAFYLYQREFFWSGLFTCLGILGLWMLRHRGENASAGWVFWLIALVLLVFLGLALYSRGEKPLSLGGRELNLLPPQAQWQPVALTLSLQLAALALALLLPSLSFYLLYLLCGWIFGLLVYFTLKML